LDPAQIHEAWALGCQMSFSESVEYALGLLAHQPR
jgi:hypothetical protein